MAYEIACYQMEEIVAEKIRALLQTHQKLIARGWSRPRARDYYDLWYILKNYPCDLNKIILRDTLQKKCDHRNVSYQKIEDFFTVELVREANRYWQATLGNFVQDLPQCDKVLTEIEILLMQLLNFQS